jgi:NAD(P)-dependent dehydrogenase (short-subunit alcohol dehydrogenase family)
MKDFADRVAVVTGAASGMGLAFATRFAGEGMKVVLADIENEPLAMAEAGLKARNADVLAVRTNVLHENDLERLADAAFSRFGNVHILCNNAGVAARSIGTAAWDATLADWEWTIGVNFWGVLYGVRAFLPRMIASGDEGHIVNTASMAGLMPGGADPYSVSKHAVVCLSEGLYRDFRARNLRLNASVLCPGFVNTNILEAERNRPREFGTALATADLAPQDRQRLEALAGMLSGGFAPEEIAAQVFEAIRDEQFYIIPTQPQFMDLVRQRFDDILARRNPAPTAFV